MLENLKENCILLHSWKHFWRQPEANDFQYSQLPYITSMHKKYGYKKTEH